MVKLIFSDITAQHTAQHTAHKSKVVLRHNKREMANQGVYSPTKVGALIFNLNILNNTFGENLFDRRDFYNCFKIRGKEFTNEI